MRFPADRFDDLFDRLTTLRAAVVGDVMLDAYLTGRASRISPEAPVPVVHVSEERVAVGGAANVASNVVALGARCELAGCVGADVAGTQLRDALARNGGERIRTHFVEQSGRPTTVKTRVMARHQQVVRFDRERVDDLPDPVASELLRMIDGAIAEADVLILQDYNKGVLTQPVIRGALAAAKQRGIPSLVDPKFRHFFEYGGATVFKPNVLELSAALGSAVSGTVDAELEDARQRVGCENLLVTLGENGMAVCHGGEVFRVPAVARDVYDVSGAGDTVSAYVALTLAAGATIEEATLLANLAAAVEVGKTGAATVTPAELRSFASAGGFLSPSDTSPDSDKYAHSAADSDA